MSRANLRRAGITGFLLLATISSAMLDMNKPPLTGLKLTTPAAGDTVQPNFDLLKGSSNLADGVIKIFINDEFIASTQATDKKWEYRLASPLPLGTHVITLHEESSESPNLPRVAQAGPFKFTIKDPNLGDLPALKPIKVIRPAPGITVPEGSLNLSGKGEPGQEVEMQVGARIVDRVRVNKLGQWQASVRVTSELSRIRLQYKDRPDTEKVIEVIVQGNRISDPEASL